ncbi:hypothetical protein I6I18_02785 [Kytococcus sedentarius]|uniref:Uncharacterized protein n=1 Tax=Kytococcus sedentarius (strain ATCC 14392 / DSM 20547 / JCM 11482 / CCUG 33030 / NBRC 15357 / NCTC 11040 / CCM 314 / 541) TaxID=478801 RepID=C7NG45_KYTSD|nr:hypothetical protein [Kytococcus sedentarius]ACV06045.1 hypothetical protein Ksed_09990 [Kytococcus sedentarius DSM 20547]QQB64414.1 hypothetical protein I6I18_02785 [Kytococcus sedentarius]STX12537.1 Uncharacterised protein [Kytococcus sedentarius]
MSRQLHPVIGFGVPLLLILLFVSMPSLVVLAIAEFRGVALTVPLPWAAFLTLLMVSVLGVLSPLLALPVKFACAAAGAPRLVQTVATTALHLALYGLAYTLLVRDTTVAFAMGALTLVIWGLIGIWVDDLEEKLTKDSRQAPLQDER